MERQVWNGYEKYSFWMPEYFHLSREWYGRNKIFKFCSIFIQAWLGSQMLDMALSVFKGTSETFSFDGTWNC